MRAAAKISQSAAAATTPAEIAGIVGSGVSGVGVSGHISGDVDVGVIVAVHARIIISVVAVIIVVLCSIIHVHIAAKKCADRGNGGFAELRESFQFENDERNDALRSPPAPSLMFNKSVRMSSGDSSAGAAAGAEIVMTFSTGAGGFFAEACNCNFSASHAACARFNCAALRLETTKKVEAHATAAASKITINVFMENSIRSIRARGFQ